MHNNKILYKHDWLILKLRGRSAKVRPEKTLERKVDQWSNNNNNNNNNNNFIYAAKDRPVDQDIDWLVLIGDQYKKNTNKVNKELQAKNLKLKI